MSISKAIVDSSFLTVRRVVRNYLFPYPSLDFIRLYLLLWRELALNGNPKYYRLVYFVLFNGTYLAISYFVMFYLEPSLIVNLVQYNAPFFYFASKSLNLVIALGCTATLCTLKLLYCHKDPWLNTFHYRLMLKNQTNLFFHWPMYKGQLISSYLVIYSQRIVKIFPMVYIHGAISGLILTIYMLVQLWNFWPLFLHFSLQTRILLLVCHFFNFALSGFFFGFVSHAVLLSSLIFAISNQIWSIKLAQSRRLIEQFSAGNWHYLPSVQLSLAQCLLYLRKADPLIGGNFTIFLLISVPLSALNFALLLSGNTSQLSFVAVPAGIEMAVLFGFHYLLANFSRHLHKPSKLFFSRQVSGNSQKPNLHTRLRLLGLFTSLHNTRVYGFTYWSTRLVTIGSFTSFLLLYGKCLIKTANMSRS